MNIETPVVFIIFNRPDLTQIVFNSIAAVKPKKLYIIADGPRNYTEKRLCKETRAIVKEIDWECSVSELFSDENLGLKLRISSGLDWVFSHENAAIILEDDCVPNLTFFQFAEELLHKYTMDDRIMNISGQNLQFGINRTPYSYYFSRYNHCWGWATWKRSWSHFDVSMKCWPRFRDEGWLDIIFKDQRDSRFWKNRFESVYVNKLDSWNYIWTFCCWSQSGLTILPERNLVSNIGFREDATHTKSKSFLSGIPTESMLFPMKHPEFVVRHECADDFTQNKIYNPKKLNTAKFFYPFARFFTGKYIKQFFH
jgi:hypothetical protein